MRLRLLLVAALLGSGLAGAPSSADALPDVPSPIVSGPTSRGLRDHIVGGVLQVPRGYVQEEFFFEGTAIAAHGPSPLGPARPGPESLPAAPYKTRMVVVRPDDARRFNGTVLVTWLNVTIGIEVDEWAHFGEQVVRDGFAYAAVSAQDVGLGPLKAADPLRYATLHIPSGAYSYDIYAQAAQALRAPITRDGAGGPVTMRVDPMHGLPVRHVIAVGASQSARALDIYLDTTHLLRKPVYDGFFISESNGGNHPAVRTPMLRFLSENETSSGTSTASDTAYYRQWEIAGPAHGTKATFDYLGAQQRRDYGVDVVGPLASDHSPIALAQSCTVNRFPVEHAFSAATVALQRWVSRGVRPPVGPRERFADGALVRDTDGNVVGGIRLPAMAVPVAAYNRTGDCVSLDGRTEYFSSERLRQLYPTKAAYVAKVRAAAQRSVKAGFLLPADATVLIRAAERSSVPERAR